MEPVESDVDAGSQWSGRIPADVHGTVWTFSKGSIQVYAPDATLPGKIPVPERVFCRPDGRRLHRSRLESVQDATRTRGTAL